MHFILYELKIAKTFLTSRGIIHNAGFYHRHVAVSVERDIKYNGLNIEALMSEVENATSWLRRRLLAILYVYM